MQACQWESFQFTVLISPSNKYSSMKWSWNVLSWNLLALHRECDKSSHRVHIATFSPAFHGKWGHLWTWWALAYLDLCGLRSTFCQTWDYLWTLSTYLLVDNCIWKQASEISEKLGLWNQVAQVTTLPLPPAKFWDLGQCLFFGTGQELF